MFILEDVGSTRGATFCDPGFRVDRPAAESMVRQLAALHGPHWQSRTLRAARPWLQTFTDLQALFNDLGFRGRTNVGLGRATDLLPASLISQRGQVWDGAIASTQRNATMPQTLLHNDTHVGNWYWASDGRMGLYDWQGTVYGGWASDLAYALSSGLEIEDRRAWEANLLDLYLDELGRYVVRPPSCDATWLAYRQQLFHGFIYRPFTLRQASLQPDMQPTWIAEANVRRIGHAVDDLDAIAALSNN